MSRFANSITIGISKAGFGEGPSNTTNVYCRIIDCNRDIGLSGTASCSIGFGYSIDGSNSWICVRVADTGIT